MGVSLHACKRHLLVHGQAWASHQEPRRHDRISRNQRHDAGKAFELQADDVALGSGASAALHPEQHERFTVLSGQLAVRLGKTWSVLGRGESVVVPPGVPHTLKNGDQAPAVITVELVPSRQMETFFETIFGLDAEGRLPPHGLPDLRQIALTFLAHDNVLASVPAWLYFPVAHMLAWLGRRAGLRAWYPKYSPHGGLR